MIVRRTMLIGAAAALGAGQARAEDFMYKGWRFDTSEVPGALTLDMLTSYRAQIDIVEGLDIKTGVKTFWRGVPTRIQPKTPGGPGAYGFDRKQMLLSTIPPAAGKPGVPA